MHGRDSQVCPLSQNHLPSGSGSWIESASRSPGDVRRYSCAEAGWGRAATRACACDKSHMVVRVMSMLQVPIVARRPAHPRGYAGLPVVVYRISWVLANIEQCCGGAYEHATKPVPMWIARSPSRSCRPARMWVHGNRWRQARGQRPRCRTRVSHRRSAGVCGESVAARPRARESVSPRLPRRRRWGRRSGSQGRPPSGPTRHDGRAPAPRTACAAGRGPGLLDEPG